MSQASSRRAVLYALGANSGILIAKGTAAALTGSSAMLAGRSTRLLIAATRSCYCAA